MSRRKQARPIRVLEDEDSPLGAAAAGAVTGDPSAALPALIGKSADLPTTWPDLLDILEVLHYDITPHKH